MQHAGMYVGLTSIMHTCMYACMLYICMCVISYVRGLCSMNMQYIFMQYKSIETRIQVSIVFFSFCPRLKMYRVTATCRVTKRAVETGFV